LTAEQPATGQFCLVCRIESADNATVRRLEVPMKTKIVWRVALVAALVFMGSSTARAQTSQTRVDGLIHDFTAALDAVGPWQIVGEWLLALNTTTGKVELTATLSMVRSDNDLRQAHNHHVKMLDGVPTPIANGFRINGTAFITSNGTLAAFSGSPVVIEITGGSNLSFSNFKVTFGGAAVGHFGPDPIEGVVRLGQ
jgi:hypothetical protein